MDRGGSSTFASAATSAVILPSRVYGQRVAFSISNYGAVTVYLSLSDVEGAVAGRGIALAPGSTFSDSNGDNYLCWQGAIHGLDAGAAGTLAVWERVK